MKLKVMTYNIFSGKNLKGERGLEFAASVIRGFGPDIVNLNEVRSHTADVGPIDQSYELARLTGYFPVFGKSIDVAGGDYGNALLTRLPLVEHEVVHIPDPEVRDDRRYEHRSVLRSVLMAGDRQITVLGTHFGLMGSEQRLAVETVTRLLKQIDTPVLFMGDLNLSPDSPLLSPIFAALNDTACGKPDPLTFPSDTPDCKIDYIFYSYHFKMNSFTTQNTQCSDHRPLFAELEL